MRALVAALAFSCLVAAPQHARAVFLTNGSAEDGTLFGWTADPEVGAVTSAEQQTGTVIPYSGSYFFRFTGAPASAVSMAQEGTGGIGLYGLRLSGAFQTELGDEAEAVLRAYDENDDLVASSTTGAMVSTDLVWEGFQLDLVLPPEAAYWRLELNGALVAGTFVNVYWDDLFLFGLPEPAEGGLAALAVLASIAMRRNGTGGAARASGA